MPNFVLLFIHLTNIYEIPTMCQALLKGSGDIEMSKNDMVLEVMELLSNKKTLK